MQNVIFLSHNAKTISIYFPFPFPYDRYRYEQTVLLFINIPELRKYANWPDSVVIQREMCNICGTYRQQPSNLLCESFKFTQLGELLNLPKVRRRQLCEHKMPAGKLPVKRIFRNILRNSTRIACRATRPLRVCPRVKFIADLFL